MNRNPYELVEQRAIELMSSLGQEHLFVANCPSNLDADKYASNVMKHLTTVVQAWVFACYYLEPMPSRSLLTFACRKTHHCILCLRAQATPVSLKQLHGFTICCKRESNMLVSCRTWESLATMVNKKNISLLVKLNPMLLIAELIGRHHAEPWNMFFPDR